MRIYVTIILNKMNITLSNLWKLTLTNNIRSVSYLSTERLTNKLVPNLKDG